MMPINRPLGDLKVLDFTTLLPGPLATLYLAEAGARVCKVERPGGDPGRANQPALAGQSLQFALLNKGKTGIVADLKDPAQRDTIRSMALEADILIEQFRPGVMERLGLGPLGLLRDNPQLIYCSITGYGQTGPLAQRAGHDLTYLARAGMLRLTDDGTGRPCLPPAQIADVGGGSLSAVIAILTAVHHRERTRQGVHLDISMTENLFAWMPRALAPVFVGQAPPDPGQGRHTGGSPRYGLHLSSDGVAFAIAPLEEKFWQRLCELLGVPTEFRARDADSQATSAALATAFAAHDAASLEALFGDDDVCVERVRDLAEAVSDPHFAARETFARRVGMPDDSTIPALPMPFPPSFLEQDHASAPALAAMDQGAKWG